MLEALLRSPTGSTPRFVSPSMGLLAQLGSSESSHLAQTPLTLPCDRGDTTPTRATLSFLRMQACTSSQATRLPLIPGHVSSTSSETEKRHGLSDSCLQLHTDQAGITPPMFAALYELTSSILEEIGLAQAPRLAFVIRDWIVTHIAIRLRENSRRSLPIRWQWRQSCEPHQVPSWGSYS